LWWSRIRCFRPRMIGGNAAGTSRKFGKKTFQEV